jgi:hypothetical protein
MRFRYIERSQVSGRDRQRGRRGKHRAKAATA